MHLPQHLDPAFVEHEVDDAMLPPCTICPLAQLASPFTPLADLVGTRVLVEVASEGREQRQEVIEIVTGLDCELLDGRAMRVAQELRESHSRRGALRKNAGVRLVPLALGDHTLSTVTEHGYLVMPAVGPSGGEVIGLAGLAIF